MGGFLDPFHPRPSYCVTVAKTVPAARSPASSERPATRGSLSVQPFLVSAVVLGLLVAAGIAVIVAVRSWWLQSGTDHGDWESALVGYKNLRDKGVLSEEEYRKITTLVEPHVRNDAPQVDRAGPMERRVTSDQ